MFSNFFPPPLNSVYKPLHYLHLLQFIYHDKHSKECYKFPNFSACNVPTKTDDFAGTRKNLHFTKCPWIYIEIKLPVPEANNST